MPSKGMIRKVDDLGRIVLPVELRRSAGITNDDRFVVTASGSSIILTKYQKCCIFCDSNDGLLEYRGKSICRKCILALIEDMG